MSSISMNTHSTKLDFLYPPTVKSNLSCILCPMIFLDKFLSLCDGQQEIGACYRICQSDKFERYQSGCLRGTSPTERENCYTATQFHVPELPTLTELRGVTAPASALSPEAEINERRLHGTKPPEWTVTEEKPWYRVAAYLFATGCTSCKQVAEICEVNERTVRNLLRNTWFQERVTKLLADNGGKDILALLRAEQYNTLVVMLELRDNSKTPSAVRAGVCKDILDRTIGKPVQRIETEDKTHSDDPVAEAHRLQEELARSRERSE